MNNNNIIIIIIIMGETIYSKNFLDKKLDQIPQSDLDSALNTTWNKNVDKRLSDALNDINSTDDINSSLNDYYDTKIQFDYNDYTNKRWTYLKNLADSNTEDVIDNNALLQIETSYLIQQSYKINKCIKSKWDETCKICYDTLEQYNTTLKYYDKLKDNIKTLTNDNKVKIHDISKNEIITNERKVWYENNELISITNTANIMQVVYYILLVLLIGVLVYKNEWRDYINIGLVIFFIIWPFISNIIILNIIKFIRYINSLFPNDVYLNLN